ncbi:MAG: hypothetical protein GY772_14290, partial [bacterium]|nr:hypothetical protein [bacterium]
MHATRHATGHASHQATVYFLSFGADADMQEWLHSHLPEAISRGLLVTASGGGHGVTWCRRLKPGLTSGRDVMLRHWHASRGKNAAHMFAIEHTVFMFGAAALESLVLVNMDCDNVCGGRFSRSLLQALERPGLTGGVAPVSPVTPSATPASAHAALTGRVAAWAVDFLRVGGYDEEPGVMGMGGQDIDLLKRLAVAALPTDTATPPEKYRTLTRRITVDGGIAFPSTNAATLAEVDHSEDRNWAL